MVKNNTFASVPKLSFNNGLSLVFCGSCLLLTLVMFIVWLRWYHRKVAPEKNNTEKNDDPKQQNAGSVPNTSSAMIIVKPLSNDIPMKPNSHSEITTHNLIQNTKTERPKSAQQTHFVRAQSISHSESSNHKECSSLAPIGEAVLSERRKSTAALVLNKVELNHDAMIRMRNMRTIRLLDCEDDGVFRQIRDHSESLPPIRGGMVRKGERLGTSGKTGNLTMSGLC